MIELESVPLAQQTEIEKNGKKRLFGFVHNTFKIRSGQDQETEKITHNSNTNDGKGNQGVGYELLKSEKHEIHNLAIIFKHNGYLSASTRLPKKIYLFRAACIHYLNEVKFL